MTVKENIKDFSYPINFDCEVNKYKAIYDIQYNKPNLLLSGGYAPMIFEGQEKFEKRYNLVYYDYGCTSPDEICMIEYNETVFKYLNKKHGKKWRKEVRKDVEGFSKRHQ